MSRSRKASAMSPVTSRPIETAGRNWLPRVVVKETSSEEPNIRAVNTAMHCRCSPYRTARSEAGPVTPPVGTFHPHSGHTGSSEAIRRHWGQIRMAACIIAYFVDPTDRKVYPINSQQGRGVAQLDPRERRIQKLEIILNVAKAMSTERDLGVLLEEIVEHARSVVDATRGSIFLLDKDKSELWSKVAQGAREIRFPADKGIAGHVAQTKKPLNIPDAYADPRFNPAVDKATGFHTRNMLTVPMLSTKDEVVGVLQVLNKNPGEHWAEVEKGAPGPPFDAEDEEMLLALGGQAASAIENAILYDEINKLFEGFIAASVVAIESRDPTTSGHSGRVATLTCGLAEVVDRVDTGPYAKVTFDYDQMKEIRYAALLHDFGKVGVREHVLVKAEKPYPNEVALLKYRFLATIPWTSKLRRIPEIAYGHHEKLDGKGYPRQITAPEIPVQTRMMTISDIYDALTASDRPYKKAVPASKALDILRDEVKEGKVDSALLHLFIDAKVYERTARG